MTSDRVAIVAADVLLPLFWRYEFFLECSLFLFCIITKHTECWERKGSTTVRCICAIFCVHVCDDVCCEYVNSLISLIL